MGVGGGSGSSDCPDRCVSLRIADSVSMDGRNVSPVISRNVSMFRQR